MTQALKPLFPNTPFSPEYRTPTIEGNRPATIAYTFFKRISLCYLILLNMTPLDISILHTQRIALRAPLSPSIEDTLKVHCETFASSLQTEPSPAQSSDGSSNPIDSKEWITQSKVETFLNFTSKYYYALLEEHEIAQLSSRQGINPPLLKRLFTQEIKKFSEKMHPYL